MERYYDNEQYAADFAMYMMASSYFNKVSAISCGGEFTLKAKKEIFREKSKQPETA